MIFIDYEIFYCIIEFTPELPDLSLNDAPVEVNPRLIARIGHIA
jgi:hypothetical protein